MTADHLPRPRRARDRASTTSSTPLGVGVRVGRPRRRARRSPAARSAPAARPPTSTGSRRRRRGVRRRGAPRRRRVRGNLVRRLGELLREHKAELGELVSIEAGKIRSEGLGEVQEMIDICDFAVGLSRQLHGLTIASERPGHRLMETWHPMGPCAVITAFNFPVAVWSWNAALALVAGDPVLWKPSDKTPLTALACDAMLPARPPPTSARRPGSTRCCRAAPTSAPRSPPTPTCAIVSATGSTRMGRAVAPVVASRFGRLILELGGNNAAIVAPDRRPRARRARHRLLGRRHRRPALHQPAPPDRPRLGRATSSSTGSPRPTPACRSAIRWPTARSSAR